MPQLARWDNLSEGVRQHLIERMRDREISVSDLNQLRLWVETRPEMPEGDWYKGSRLFQSLRQRIVPQNVPTPRASRQGRSPLIITLWAIRS